MWQLEGIMHQRVSFQTWESNEGLVPLPAVDIHSTSTLNK